MQLLLSGRAERSRCRRARGLFGVAGSQGATGPKDVEIPKKKPMVSGDYIC